MSKFCLDFENFWNKKTNCLKIIIVNHYFLIRIEFQFLKETYSSNELFVNMQHRETFRFRDENRDDELLFDSSVDQIIKQFEDIFFNVSSIEIICKERINDFSKIYLSLFSLFVNVFIFNIKFDVEDILYSSSKFDC
jgi:hypothetical protein